MADRTNKLLLYRPVHVDRSIVANILVFTVLLAFKALAASVAAHVSPDILSMRCQFYLFVVALAGLGLVFMKWRGHRKRDCAEINCDLIPARLKWPMFLIAAILFILPLPTAHLGHFSPLCLITVGAGIALFQIQNSRLKIVADEGGIEAVGLLPRQSMNARAKRSWKDIHSIRLSRYQDRYTDAVLSWKPLAFLKHQFAGLDQTYLVFDFTSGGSFSLPLGRISEAGLDTLMLTLTRFADPLKLNSDVAALQRTILTIGADTSSLDFTKFWQDNLKLSFAETNFVPLAGGHKLRQGELTVLLPLSSGGAGAVYMCADGQGKQYILKELSLPAVQDQTGQSKLLQLFEREAQILAKLDHPKIVRVLDSFVEQQRQYILLEFAPGITLRQYVHLKGPLNEESVRRLAKQVAEILQYLHSFDEPIIHRDITPDNLVLSEDNGELTLIDFGAANEVALQAASTIIGKQCYIAPEQLRGAACIQSDLFSLGATMFFLLVGFDPEPISTSYPAGRNAGVSPAMNSLVAGLTAAETSARPKSAQDLIGILNRPDLALMSGAA